ncbi:hypothetical protein [Pontibacter actiniarum]|uniref:Uncharacterized protein n=1 Tax=Pontibacter actiniarum TaxID=323450 RepID=A0A1X9YQV4_9BACT|nr:hypothetical protein [Pontibacter actiniarum]ARS35221.1 hypothetical protein CA264_07075 [Pontibacter actiniarum]
MTKQPQYTTIARDAFGKYIDDEIDLDQLLERLRYIEQQVISEDEDETEKTVWFRFFEGDPLHTTISEVGKDLSDPSHPNCALLQRGIALGLQAGELEVHYS